MVIFLDKTIHEELQHRELTEAEAIFFSDLANAHHKGRCFLCGDEATIDDLQKHLGNPSNGIYRAIRKRFAENGAIFKRVNKVLVLSFLTSVPEDGLPHILRDADKTEIGYIPTVSSWKLNEGCRLLGENLDDCTFYKRIAVRYLHDLSIKGVGLYFDSVGGGGSTVGEQLREFVEEGKRVTLCIVDGDQKWGQTQALPNEPPKGGTYIAANEISKKLRRRTDIPPSCLYLLKIHEVENLIPLEIYEKLMHTIPSIETGVEFLKRLLDIYQGTPLLYYDIKNGLPYIKAGAKRDYWEEIFRELNGTPSDFPPFEDPKGNVAGAQQPFFPPIQCSHLLKKVNDLLKGEYLTCVVIDPPQDKYWREIGELMLTWGCANIPTSA